MNRHLAVPFCVDCQIDPVSSGQALVCPLCGKVIEDFSPPRKRWAAKRQVRWEPSRDGGWVVRFRDKLLAAVQVQIAVDVVHTPEGPALQNRIMDVQYILFDSPVLRALSLAPAAQEGNFPSVEKARAALERLLQGRWGEDQDNNWS